MPSFPAFALTLLSFIAVAPALAEPLSTRDTVCLQPRGPMVSIRPGVNEVLPLSRGHLNRLLTPFQAPQATTVNEAATVQVKGTAVYVALTEETPVALYLTEQGSEAVAISLTLVPCLLPPQEITLQFVAGVRLPVTPAPAPASPVQPYLTALTGMLRDLALGRTPAGFALRSFQPGADPMPACAWPEIQIVPGQVLESPTWLITVAVARNTGATPVELVETTCAADTVAAVAAWPQPYLAAGQAIEVYLVTRRPPPAETAGAPRPSLLRVP